MNWSPVKISVVTIVVLLFVAATIWFATKAIRSTRAAQYPNIEGAWQGTLDAGQVKLRLVFKFTKDGSGYSSTIDSIDQNAPNIPVTSLAYEFPSLRMEAKSVRGSYEAKVNADATEMSGTWSQGRPMALVLKRTDSPDTIPTALKEGEYTPRKGSDVQGYWKGTLLLDKVPLRLVLKISEDTDGTFRAAMDSLDQGANDLAATTVVYKQPALYVEFSGIGGVFQGTVQANAIKGNWTQRGKTFPLTFDRADPNSDKAQETGKSYYFTDKNDLQGHWKGTLEIKQANAKLRLILNIGKMPDGTFSGSMISVDQGGAEVPANVVTFFAPDVHLEWQGLGASFDGAIKTEKSAAHSSNEADRSRLNSREPPSELRATPALQCSSFTRMRRYSIWPRSPSRPIGPVAGTFIAASSTSPLHVQ